MHAARFVATAAMAAGIGLGAAQAAPTLPIPGTGYAGQVGVDRLTVLVVVAPDGAVHFYNGQVGYLQAPEEVDFKDWVRKGYIKEYPLRSATVSGGKVHFVTQMTGTTYDLQPAPGGGLVGQASLNKSGGFHGISVELKLVPTEQAKK